MSDTTPDSSMAEVYLQISPNILASFPKFRPPVDIYYFDDRVGRVKRYHEADKRLGTEGQALVATFASEGVLFLLRDDYRVYAKHLSKNLGLVLTEDDFTPQEVAEIFFQALSDRLNDFLAQPKEQPYEGLGKDISILVEYLWVDPARVECLVDCLHTEYDLAGHSVNTLFVGLALFIMALKGKLKRASLLSVAMGLILHDMGMTNVSKFILDNTSFLVRTDRESIENHIDAGLAKLKRLGVSDPIVLQCLTEHHERVDGSGYPQRLMNKSLSLPGRLCGVADSFSAIISERPYHEPMDRKKAALVLMKDAKRYDQALTKLLAVLLTQGVAPVLQAS
ncbi:HD domain-containing protein [Pseudodesulfovibrio cashew]|uniref:HD domain-containing protein n=1 Tax=Pseudodesulfovibrio cashew TaxID=2678688 RepID=A0A6I6JLK5_9BACT|nr:HD domain-containing phosphohydrolase [Pseudodesulfovibrio cashew]QGY38604.1 HD domain-containing protein [Pseudodesulfovibrio cashew]